MVVVVVVLVVMSVMVVVMVEVVMVVVPGWLILHRAGQLRKPLPADAARHIDFVEVRANHPHSANGWRQCAHDQERRQK